jgi:hypothetical protein
MTTTPERTPDDARFTQEIARLAEAIRDLAHRPGRPDSDEESEQRRRIQRVDFGYRALGALMGRAGRGFDVPVFDASWYPRYRVIVLSGLPDEVEFVQLQNGVKDETLKVRRGRDDHDSPYKQDATKQDATEQDATEQDATEQDATESRGGELPPWISPEKFTPDDAISSVLGLRHRRGPVIALGPRIAPVPSYA